MSKKKIEHHDFLIKEQIAKLRRKLKIPAKTSDEDLIEIYKVDLEKADDALCCLCIRMEGFDVDGWKSYQDALEPFDNTFLLIDRLEILEGIDEARKKAEALMNVI